MFVFGLTVLLSAFLLFQVQPLVNKYILPWFGGTPAVWSTSMLFFQVLLTGGYAYAYWLAGQRSTRKQCFVHLVLLGCSALLLILLGLVWDTPITPGAAWKPLGVGFPIWHIFKILLVSVGLPYFMLSTNGPLMQAWFSHVYPERSPYRLYALSNVGSMVALVSFPFLFEPVMALRTQADLWSWAYVVFALFAGFLAVRTARVEPVVGAAPSREETPTAAVESRPAVRVRVLWVLLAASASVMLLATTNQISQEVAVIPFLWVLPLTLYLLSFVLTFSSERWYSRRWYTLALLVSSVLFVWILVSDTSFGYLAQIVIFSVVLFVCCMICHGELVLLKPSSRFLTSFYLMVSIGGAIGGIAVSLIAPLVFTGFWELPLGLLSCGVLRVIVAVVERPAPQSRRSLVRFSAFLAIVMVSLVVVLTQFSAAFLGVAEASRNFYGILRVTEATIGDSRERVFKLTHGETVHGFQFWDAVRRSQPTAYFTEESGIGLALRHYPFPESGRRIGVLGLGIGTLAAYGESGDTIRFYEINPEVVRFAEGEGGYFTYLKDSAARVELVLGDARIMLERELEAGEPQQFDLLVLDAFSSDSIPVHLLTKEAFDTYLQHLRPDGLLALNISNRYLDLRPVVWRLADDFQLESLLIESAGDGAARFASTWMLLSPDEGLSSVREIASRSSPRPESYRPPRLWTDDYSNLFRFLK